jgi:hypothetical protein
MAKVKGPLMSMDARGQIGKALVFIGWKGIKDVRSFVVPANPRTSLQTAQRGIMTDAVAAYHTAAFNVLDLAALNLWATLQTMVMSGFNVFCKMFIDYILAGSAVSVPHGMTITSNTGGTVGISITNPGTDVGKARYGYSPSVMGNVVNLTHSDVSDPYTYPISGLTVGEYVYIQVYTTTADKFWDSGIYKVLVLA